MNGMVERRMKRAIISIGSIWYTAWVDAGQPDLRALQYSKPSEDLINELEDLYSIFEEIKYSYEYIPSSTDASKKETTIKSKHTVEIADGDLEAIIAKIKSIRTEIVE